MFYVDENQQAKSELSYEFPLAVHKTYLKDKPRGFNDWHWHEEGPDSAVCLSLNIQPSLLTDTDASAAEIAGRCGFNNTSYYTKVFREKVGTTPLRYRKMKQLL